MDRAENKKPGSGFRFSRIACVVIGAFLLHGCAATDTPKQATLPTSVTASPELNPNRRGNPQPVKLHIYYLRQDEAFAQANYSELITAEPASIKDDLIRRTEQLIGPGESIPLDEQFDEETAFIGVVAEFTNIGDAQWRAIVSVPEGSWRDLLRPFKSKRLVLDVDSLAVSGVIIEE